MNPESFRHYVERFNADDTETVRQTFPNDKAWPLLRDNIPLFACPDANVERTWYFRWWVYRKHLKQTPDGWVVTEFLPPVSWAGKHNTISATAMHHINEGRWLRDPAFMDDYVRFWLKPGGGSLRSYSSWLADAAWNRHLARPDDAFVTALLPALIENEAGWAREKRDAPDGLYWQIDDRDGMEVSVSGHGYRATINSYRYADARAIARIAALAGKPDVAAEWDARADRLRTLVMDKLWNDKTQFFRNVHRDTDKKRRPDQLVIDPEARELYGLVPWAFGLPPTGRGYEVAWKQVTDPQGFYAPYGLTSVERRHPGFRVRYEGHPCQWNGPSWPFVTTLVLQGMANVIRDTPQDAIDRRTYFEQFLIYARAHQLTRPDGRVVPWVDENIDPYTGTWIAHERVKALVQDPATAWHGPADRGKDYNHSAFADLVITGLCGLRPRADDTVEVDPLLPAGVWPWFCLDRVPYHGRMLTIVWDADGEKFGGGAGLTVMADGKVVAHADRLQRVAGKLPGG